MPAGQDSEVSGGGMAVFDRTCLTTHGLLPLLHGKAARVMKVQLAVLRAVGGLVFFFRALCIICAAMGQAVRSLAGQPKQVSALLLKLNCFLITSTLSV